MYLILKNLAPRLKLAHKRLKRWLWANLYGGKLLTERVVQSLNKHRLGVVILTPAPDDDSSDLSWREFNHNLVHDGNSFKLQVGPFSFKIQPLTAYDLEQMRKTSPFHWMCNSLKPVGKLSELINRTIGIPGFIFRFADAKAISEAASEISKMNMAVKKKMWGIAQNDAPSNVIRRRSTQSSWNLAYDVWDLVITGDE